MLAMRNKLMFSNMAALRVKMMSSGNVRQIALVRNSSNVKVFPFSHLIIVLFFRSMWFFGYVIMSGSAEKVTGRFDTKSFRYLRTLAKWYKNFDHFNL